ncbi:hypothetical protein K470DRAFT_287516 [Piedraia hortae CBS 480.64]|uniref:Uncharacterized protein n=1 Tax=Piedraia hortae CBS 480.64 TaxID=1314780 RepID=A0A6A7BYX3_9PEZI|nr:hypothetical protein K470DRAFT_287516 [Piedraia hortae CBS 480.64]
MGTNHLTTFQFFTGEPFPAMHVLHSDLAAFGMSESFENCTMQAEPTPTIPQVPQRLPYQEIVSAKINPEQHYNPDMVVTWYRHVLSNHLGTDRSVFNSVTCKLQVGFQHGKPNDWRALFDWVAKQLIKMWRRYEIYYGQFTTPTAKVAHAIADFFSWEASSVMQRLG